MTLHEIVFFAIGITGLGVLCMIVAAMGRALADCPDTGRAARAGAMVVLTGLACFGLGAIALIGAFLPVLTESGFSPLYLALGFCALALGVGFTYAAERLRDVVQDAANRIAARDAARAGATLDADLKEMAQTGAPA